MGSSPHLWFCACKTATLGPEIQACIGPRPHLRVWALITACLAQKQNDYIGSRPHLWFCACKTATLGLELQVSMGTRPHLSFCACKSPWLAPAILVSISSSPHLWFLDAKQRLFDQNYKSLWVPDLTCRFVHAKQRDLHQYDKSILVPALICVFFPCKTTTLVPDLQVCMGPRLHLWFWADITACLSQE